MSHFNLRHLASESLLGYCIAQNKDFMVNHHHKVLAAKLEAVERGEIRRLIINMPPRHGKSYLASQLFPTWFLGRNPNKQIICATYGQDLANDFGRSVRNFMATENYKEIFDVHLSEDSKSKKKFNTNMGGAYYAVGRGGSLTGRGGDLIVVDDLLKNEIEARSIRVRESMKDFYRNTLYSRLMPKAPLIIINTRWHQDDLCGWLLRESHDDWEVINMPAISDGKALWPDYYDIDTLQAIKREIGTQAFEALYQQSPIADGGNIIKKEWLKTGDVWPNCNQYIQSWDLTFKGNDSNDYVVGQLYGKFGANIYLIDQVKGKWDFVETINQIKMFSNKHPKALVKLIEDKANGPAVISTLKNTLQGLKAVNPKSDKVSRVHSITPILESGNLIINQDLPYLNDFVDECMSFPNSRHDDQVDAMTQAISYFTQSVGSGFATSGGTSMIYNDELPGIFDI